MASSKNQENTGQLFKAYSAETPEEVSGCYDNWADDYESHMRNVGYLHPAMVASLLARHLPPGTDPILDAGAGTGPRRVTAFCQPKQMLKRDRADDERLR